MWMNPESCQAFSTLPYDFPSIFVTPLCRPLPLTIFFKESNLTKHAWFSSVSGGAGWAMRKRSHGTPLRHSVTIWSTFSQSLSNHTPFDRTPKPLLPKCDLLCYFTCRPLGSLVSSLFLPTFLQEMPPWNSREQHVPTPCKLVLEYLHEHLLKNKPETWFHWSHLL